MSSIYKKRRSEKVTALVNFFDIHQFLEERMFEAMLPAPKTTAKKNVGEDILKKMGWKGKGHGK